MSSPAPKPAPKPAPQPAPKPAPKPARATPAPRRVVAQTPRRSALAQIVHLTPAEHAARGKAARAAVPRSSHGVWQPFTGRPDPVALLEEQSAARVPELVPIRYGRMLVSPFTFYRGGAYLMASDLAHTPVSGLNVQLCGDAHLSNFGGFASAERSMVFDINDFDETLPGPWEFDVKRLSTSFEIAGRDRGFSAAQRAEAVGTVARSYREAMAAFATMRDLDVWYSRLDIDALIPEIEQAIGAKGKANFERNLAKARTKDSMKALAKLTHLVDGQPKILSDPPLVVPIAELVPSMQAEDMYAVIRLILRQYRSSLQNDRRVLVERYRLVDMARKVVGVGSVGTRAWVLLMLGRDGQDPLFLQVKEASASVLERFVGASAFKSHGRRVVEGQRLMQSSSDIFLGWVQAKGFDGVTRDFYVRQLWDWKASADVESFSPKALVAYAHLCAWTLARAHARSGDRMGIAAYLGTGATFDRALMQFSTAYADQNEADYAAFQAAVESGRISAETGR
jgi:uncharacterized protein (DUF2252 family)